MTMPPTRSRAALPARVALLLLLLHAAARYADCKQPSRKRTRAQKAGRDPSYDEFGIERSRKGGRREASSEQTSYLPDRGNKQVARELRCSLCVATADEVWNALPRRKADGRRPKQFEIEDALEDLCTELEKCALFTGLTYIHIPAHPCECITQLCTLNWWLDLRYGLQMEHNRPTHRYSKREHIARHKGGWVEKYAVSVCSELRACARCRSPTLSPLRPPLDITIPPGSTA